MRFTSLSEVSTIKPWRAHAAGYFRVEGKFVARRACQGSVVTCSKYTQQITVVPNECCAKGKIA